MGGRFFNDKKFSDTILMTQSVGTIVSRRLIFYQVGIYRNFVTGNNNADCNSNRGKA